MGSFAKKLAVLAFTNENLPSFVVVSFMEINLPWILSCTEICHGLFRVPKFAVGFVMNRNCLCPRLWANKFVVPKASCK